MSVLTSAIDTEGQPARRADRAPERHVPAKGQEPITFADTFSGPRYTGQMGASALFSPLASIANMLVKNPMAPVRIEGIDCEVEIEPGRKVATIESVRLLSDTVEPGKDLKAFVTLKPFKGEREIVEIVLPIPGRLSRGDARGDLQRRDGIDSPSVPQRAHAGGAARPDAGS